MRTREELLAELALEWAGQRHYTAHNFQLLMEELDKKKKQIKRYKQELALILN